MKKRSMYLIIEPQYFVNLFLCNITPLYISFPTTS